MKVVKNNLIYFVCVVLLLGCGRAVDTSFHPQDPQSQYRKVVLFKGKVTHFKYRRYDTGGYEIIRENDNSQALLYTTFAEDSNRHFKAGDLYGHRDADYKFLLIGYYNQLENISNKHYKGRYIKYSKYLNDNGEITPYDVATLHRVPPPPGGAYAEYTLLNPSKIDEVMGILLKNSKINDNHEDHNIKTEKIISVKLYDVDKLVREEKISVSDYFYMMYRIPRPGGNWKE